MHDLWRASTALDGLVEHAEPDFLLTVLGSRSAQPTAAAHGTDEPECGLDVAVANGEADPERVESFRRLLAARSEPLY